MKALQFTDIDRLGLIDIPIPEPGPNEVLIRTGTTTICTSDIQDMRENAFGIDLPVVFGHEGAGTIEAVGEDVIRLAVGDRVAAHPVHPCLECETCREGMGHLCPEMKHFGLNMPGTFAEYFVARGDRVRRIPDAVPFTAAALAEPVCVCLEALHQANLAPGGQLLIVGDGPFGLLMARLAPRLGIERVTVSGHHPSRLAYAGSALPVVVPREGDVEPLLREASGGRGYDAIILAVSRREMVNTCLGLLRPTGRLVIFAPMPGETGVDLFQVLLRELEIVGAVNDRNRFDESIAALADPAVGAGELVTHQFTLDDFAAAFETAEHDRANALKVAFTFDGVTLSSFLHHRAIPTIPDLTPPDLPSS